MTKKENIPFSKRFQVYLASLLGWVIFLGLGSTLRFYVKGWEHVRRLRRSGQNFLIAVWHGRIFLPVYVHRYQGITVIVSRHWDGEMIARTIKMLGFKTARGSSTRGGQKVFREMISILKNGGSGANIPDGPNGPAHKMKPGTAFLSQKSGVPILPMSFAASSGKKFHSWDRFLLPQPFSKVIVTYGEPIYIPRDWSSEQVLAFLPEIERRLTQVEKQADEFFQA